MVSSLAKIQQFGQKVWIDNLSRRLIFDGYLKKLLEEDKIAGITSNPTIFYKAISTDKYYQDDLSKVKQSILVAEERYESIVIPDIQAACDMLLPLYVETNSEDGYVSFEVSPHLAYDKEETVKNAKRLWQNINRPNSMIKIPATVEGIAAFEELIRDGINVNITLLFSLSQVIATWNAYLAGLRNRVNNKLPIDTIKAVASFFISRVDSKVDSKLPSNLQGKTAINLAKMAYLSYNETFNSEGFSALKRHGARGQYLLWASTGTKDPRYSDVLYVEELIGKYTINTIPDATLDAFRDHGVVRESLTKDLDQTLTIIDQIQQYTDMDEIGNTLQQEGIELFKTSFDSLINLVK